MSLFCHACAFDEVEIDIPCSFYFQDSEEQQKS